MSFARSIRIQIQFGITSRLALADGLSVLEPAVGDGAFVEVLRASPHKLEIFCVDKNIAALDLLHNRFGEDMRALCADTILDQLAGESGLLRQSGMPEKFDRIIGNPPYGGWLDYRTRAALKKAYPGFHVRETYALFMLRCLDLLSSGGTLSFIVPDTFLAVGAHRQLRDLLLRRTEFVEIITLPSKLFPGVAFGYSGLCIVTMRKPVGSPAEDHRFEVIAINSADELNSLARGDRAGASVQVVQRLIAQRQDSRIWTTSELDVETVIQNAKLRLGDLADCKTGIYTGDNKRFIRSFLPVRQSVTAYQCIDTEDVCHRALTDREKHSGISDGPTWTPIVKGGSHKFLQITQWAIDWSRGAVEHYRSDAKARLQNQPFYFRQGIGVPMVTSSRINAFLIEQRVFDQSVVGIFPRRAEWLFALLAILNSAFATKLLKEAINPTANNSANYLKKLPIPKLTNSELRYLGASARLIAARRRRGFSTAAEELELDEQVRAFYVREASVTTRDTWSDLAGADADTPLFPCLRETPRSYGSTTRDQSR